MAGLVDYPLVLRPECTAHVRLPADVTSVEIERVVKMIRTLPVEPRYVSA